MSSWLVRTESSAVAWMHNPSRMAVLYDGTAVFAIPYNDGSSTLAFYTAPADRLTAPTLRFTRTTVTPYGYSLVADADDNLHLAFVTSGNAVVYQKFTKGAGLTWTAETSYTVAAAQANRQRGRIDLDVLDAGGVVVIAFSEIDTATHISRLKIQARYGVNGVSGGTIWEYATGASLTRENSFMCTIARDAGPSELDGFDFAVAYAGNTVTKPRIQHFRADGAGLITPGAVLSHPIPAGPTYGLLFSTGGNEWSLMAAGEWMWAVRFHTWGMGWYGTDYDSGPFDGHPPTFGYANGQGIVFTGPSGTPSAVDATTVLFGSAGDTSGEVNWNIRHRFAYRGGSSYRWKTSGANRNLGLDKVDVVFSEYTAGRHYFAAYETQAAPTGLTPTGTVTTDRPQMGARLPTKAEAGMQLIGTQTAGTDYPRHVYWELATDPTFVSNSRIFDLDQLSPPGPVHVEMPAYAELFQGTWYVRSWAEDSFDGPATAYSPTQTFVVAHKPSGAPLSPSNNIYLPWGTAGSLTFSWRFSDPSPFDFQTAYRVVVERADDGSVVVDSGKVSGATTTPSLTVPSGFKDVQLRWRVMVWDSDDVASAWSNYALFFTSDVPVVTITSPVAGSTVDNPAPTVTWGLATAAGRIQKERRVVYSTPGGQVVHDSGWGATTDTSYAPSTPVLENDESYTVTVEVRDAANLSGTDTNAFEAAWIPPASPPFVVDDSIYGSHGYTITAMDISDEPGTATYTPYYGEDYIHFPDPQYSMGSTPSQPKLTGAGVSDPVLAEAEMLLLASAYDGSNTLRDLSGKGHHAQLGSALTAKLTGNALQLPGISGNYASTPDAAALRITGDLDLRAVVALDSWVVTSSLIGRWNPTANNKSYGFYLVSTGALALQLSADGINSTTATSTATITAVAGERLELRVTYLQSTKRVQFFTRKNSTDAWVQLGTNVTHGQASIFAGTAELEIGSFISGTSYPSNGKFYSAEVRSGIHGTLVGHFDATGRTGPTWLASTGERWTVNSTIDANDPTYLPFTGGDHHLDCSGLFGLIASTPSNTPLQIGGDLQIDVDVQPATWRPGGLTNYSFVSKRSSSTGEYSLRLTGVGRVELFWYTATVVRSALSTIAVPADAGRLKIRAIREMTSTGYTVRFYTSTDGFTYTQLGADVSGSDVGDATATNHNLAVGSEPSGFQVLVGRLFSATVRNGVGGTVVANFDANQPLGTTSWVSGGLTWTLGAQGAIARTGQYLALPGVNGNVTSSTVSNVQVDTGTLEVICDVRPTTWRQANTLVGKWSNTATGTRWYVSLQSSGVLEFRINNLNTATDDTIISSAAITNDTLRRGVRVVYQRDTGSGSYSVRFYTSANGIQSPTWVELGAERTGPSQAATTNDNSVITVGSLQAGNFRMFLGDIYRARVLKGDALVSDFNPQRAFEPFATIGSPLTETWTITRPTAGLKAALVDRPMFLFGTDDSMEVPDDPALNFGANDPFTIVFASRRHNAVSGAALITKSAPWNIRESGTGAHRLTVNDGTVTHVVDTQLPPLGVLHVSTFTRSTAPKVLRAYLNGTQNPAALGTVTDTTTGPLTSGSQVSIGKYASFSHADMEFVGAAVFRRALSAAEVAQVSAAMLVEVPTTELELRAKLDFRGTISATSALGKTIMAKRANTAGRSWTWYVNSLGRMAVWITPDGTDTGITIDSGVDVRTLVSMTGPVTLSVRIIHDSGGVTSAQFRYRTDGFIDSPGGWTVIDTVSHTAIVRPFAGTNRVTINAQDADGFSSNYDIYRALILDSNGTTLADFDARRPLTDLPTSQTFTAVTGELWTLQQNNDNGNTRFPAKVTAAGHVYGYRDPNFSSWRLYRREVGTDDWTLLLETGSTLAFDYQDWMVPSNLAHEYAITQVANRFGVKVESLPQPVVITPRAESYWLIHPDDKAQSILLHSVVSDTYEEEYEEATINLIGRGRKVEHGTRFGFHGSLVAHLRDQQVAGKTARMQKREIEALKAQRRELFLRTPFGDIWQVAMSNVSVGRVAGVGNREFVDVTIPYLEVT